MLSAVRDWLARRGFATAEPLCFVVTSEAPLREELANILAKFGPQVEQFPDVAALEAAATAQQPDLVLLDVAFGNLASEVTTKLAALAKRPALLLFNASQIANYEQLCAVGQAKLAAEKSGLRVLPMLQAPFKPDAIKRGLGDLGLLRATDKTSVTLADAIKRNWLELWYQPKIDLAAQRLVGAEGLIRVRHPELGVLPPGAFLPGAREQDWMAMTEYVILSALRDYDDLAAHGVSVKLSVNTPVSALTTLPIDQMLRKEKPRSQNWPGLILEVTEDEIISDIAVANEVADRLRAHNCSLAIDDFGAGYSSLSRLRQLPFSELKIDRSYVMNCHTDRTNAGLCETIIELAHRFGLKAVAEGIELMHESHKLQGLGCDIGQGYLFAKPMAKHDFVALLQRRLVHRPQPAEQPRRRARA